ncbi:hypothetical protein D1BOALGB6SA_8375 [Olavius sp. associated proteobacterium Delta 1]|nr:hypothetical protein D1BOALGB6SA_8375 [Olavius sp. associated proteobacterium Delta 1]
MQLSKITNIAAGLLAIFLFGTTAIARDYYQLPGVVHVHTTYSSGRYSIKELVAKADEKKLGVLILTDHDRVAMEYGLFPLRYLIKKREEKNSVLRVGPDIYLSEIKRLNTQQDAVLVIPGVQSSPFYYWRGNPFGQGLTAYDYRKELLLIGLTAPDDYYNLPQLHGGFSTRYMRDLLPRFLIFFAVFLLSVYLLFQKGKFRIGGLVVALLSIGLMINHHPFKSSRFDPYHGDQGTAPFQEVINYAKSRGGLVFWAHPESNYSKNGVRMGPIKMVTEHYPDELIDSNNYTGFAAIYGDSSSAASAGMHWDQILMDYCRGRRDQPVWAIAGSDFHEEQNGVELDTLQTIFLVNDKRSQDVLQALERGRIYAVQKSKDSRLSLDQFNVKEKSSGKAADMGEEINVTGTPIVEGRISVLDGSRQDVTVSIVRDGKQTWAFEGQTPLDFHLVDQDGWTGKTFYRLDVKSKTGGYLLSNPIFVTRKNG